MRKTLKYVALLALLIVCAGLNVTFVPAEDLGCCGNIARLAGGPMESAICGTPLAQSFCCPEPIYFTYDNAQTNPIVPDSQSDCNSNYWKKDCAAISTCRSGCCYKPTETKCLNSIQYLCAAPLLWDVGRLSDQPADWQSLTSPYHQYYGNPCYYAVSGNLRKVFSGCPGEVEVGCDDYTVRDSCTAAAIGCSWCPAGTTPRCVADCDECTPGWSRDASGVCAYLDVQCSSFSKETCSKTTEKQCFWCPVPAGTGACVTACDANNCPGYLFSFMRNCTPGGQCDDRVDNDADGRTDLADICCLSAGDLSEDNNCACPESHICADYGAQCSDNYGAWLSKDRYDESVLPQGISECCNTTCRSLEMCADKKKMNVAEQQFPAVPPYNTALCKCGSTKVNVSNVQDPNYDKYCCNSIIQDDACTTLVVKGVLKDSENEPITDIATAVTLAREEGAPFTLYFARAGSFSDTVPIGSYTLRVSVPNMETYEDTVHLSVTDAQPGGVCTRSSGGQCSCALGVCDLGTITLESAIGRCKTEFPMEVVFDNVECMPQINISWTFYCPDEVTEYNIFRGERQIKTIKAIDLQKSGDGEDAVHYVEYIDEVDWETDYHYRVEAMKRGIVVQRLNDSTQDKDAMEQLPIDSGDSFCGFTCDTNYFCYTTNQKESTAFCNPENVIEYDECDAGKVCVVSGAGAVCKDVINCSKFGTEIPVEYRGANVLGMYSANLSLGSGETCLIENPLPPQVKRYCYLDRYETTVDDCRSCSPSMYCYDYLSGSACQTDNCQVGAPKEYDGAQVQIQDDPAGYATACRWFESAESYGELGRGVCYAQGFNSSGYCQRCSDQNEIFGSAAARTIANAHCTPIVCDLLGACFPDDDQSRCNSCSAPAAESVYSAGSSFTACESFLESRSCVGTSNDATPDSGMLLVPFDIMAEQGSVSAKSFTESHDACNLGVCRWTIQNRCVKDGNDDGLADCTSSMADAEYAACIADTMPPLTELVPSVAQVNQNGLTLVFGITDFGWGQFAQTGNVIDADAEPTADNNKYTIYYCIKLLESDTDVAGCVAGDWKDIYALTNSKTLPLDADTLANLDLQNKVGTMSIQYFAVDGFNNTGTIKEHRLPLDTLIDINISYSSELIEGTKKSRVVFFINATEEGVTCSDDLRSQYEIIQAIPHTSIDLDQINGGDAWFGYYAISEFSQIPDGYYTYQYECADTYGNAFEADPEIYINNDKTITILSPQPNAVQTKNVRLAMMSEVEQGAYPIECGYKKSGESQFHAFDMDNRSSQPVDGFMQYYFESTIEIPTSGDYTYVFGCYEASLNDPARKLTEEPVTFKVDTQPPAVTLKVLIPNWPSPSDFVESQAYPANRIFKLECTDTGGYGCNPASIKYCRYWPGTCENASYCSSWTAGTDIQSVTSTTCLCYKADDMGGNALDADCVNLTIDSGKPMIQIVSPTINDVIDNQNVYVTRAESVDIKFNWQDDSSSLLVVTDNDNSAVTDASKISILKSQDTLTVGLGSGKNTIKLTGTEHPISYFYSDPAAITVYRDNTGPEVVKSDIYAEGRTGAFNLIATKTGNTGSAEYGKRINFTIEASDKLSKEVTKAKFGLIDVDAKNTLASDWVMAASGTPGRYHVLFDPAATARDIYMSSISGEYVLSTPIIIPRYLPAKTATSSGNYTAEYKIYDGYGYYTTYRQNFTVVDTIGPAFNITFETAGMNYNAQGLPKVKANVPYNIKVSHAAGYSDAISTLKLNYSLLPGSTVGGTSSATLADLQSPTMPQGSIRLEIPDYFKNLAGQNAQFNIRANDSNGINGTDILGGKFFEIDTTPPNQVSLYTLINGGRVLLSEGNNNVVSQSSILVFGIIRQGTDGINGSSVQLRIDSGNLDSRTGEYAANETGRSEFLSSIERAGSGAILTFNQVLDTTSAFNAGRYIRFSGFDSPDFKYYPISAALVQSQQTKITISGFPEGLDPASVDMVYAYDKRAPTGYFDYTVLGLDVNGANGPVHTLNLTIYDDMGNGAQHQDYAIIYDRLGPEILINHPKDGLVTSDRDVKLNATITDAGGVSKSSIVLLTSVNGAAFQSTSCSSNLLTCTDKAQGVVEVVQSFTQSMPSNLNTAKRADFTINLSAADVIGQRSDSGEIDFAVDLTVPADPIIEGEIYEDVSTIYISNEPKTIAVDFGTQPIISFGANLTPCSKTACDGVPIKLTCAKASASMTFDCELQTAQNQREPGKYLFVAKAKRCWDTTVQEPCVQVGSEGSFPLYIIKDVTPPTVTITVPQMTNTKKVAISGTCQDGYMIGTERISSPIESISVSGDISGDPDIECSSLGTFEQEVTVTDTDSSKAITVRAYDKAGNFGLATGTVVLDQSVTAPQIEVTPSTYTSTGRVKVNGTSEAGTIVQVFVNNQEAGETFITDQVQGPVTLSITPTGVKDSTGATISALSVDVGTQIIFAIDTGNSGLVGTIVHFMGDTEPLPFVSGRATKTMNAAGTFAYSVTYPTGDVFRQEITATPLAARGVFSFDVTATNYQGLTTNEYKIYAKATDRPGNTRQSEVVTLTYDNTLPMFEGAQPVPQNTISIGNPRIAVTIKDTQGIDMDTISLIINQQVIAAGVTKDRISDTEYRLSYTPATQLANKQQYTVEAQAADRAGNIGRYSWSFNVDYSAPQIGSNIVQGAYYQELDNIVLTSQPASEIVTFKIYNGIGEGKTAIAGISKDMLTSSADSTMHTFENTESLSAGSYTLEVYAKLLGSTEISVGEYLREFHIDSGAPQIVFDTDRITTNKAVVISGTIQNEALDSIKHVKVGTYDAQLGSRDGRAAFSYTYSPSATTASGDYVLSFSAEDKAGNTGSAAFIVKYDKDSPQVSVSADSYSVNTAQPQVKVTVNEASEITLSVNGEIGMAFTASAAGTSSKSVTLQPGLNEIYAIAKDLAGNIAESASIHINVDSEGPFVLATYMPGDGDRLGILRPVKIWYTVQDDNTGIDESKLKLLIDGAETEGITHSCDANRHHCIVEYNMPLEDLAVRTVDIEARAYDMVGTRLSFTWSFELVDGAPGQPIISSGDLNQYRFTGDTTPIFSVEAEGTIVASMDSGVFRITCAPIAAGSHSYTCTMDEELDYGPHTMTVIVTSPTKDTATASFNFIVDTTAPRIWIDDWPKLTNRDYAYVAGSYDETNLDGIFIQSDKAKFTAGVPVAGEETYAGELELVEGQNVVTATVSDLAGHSASDSKTVIRDTAMPGISISSVSDSTPVPSQQAPQYWLTPKSLVTLIGTYSDDVVKIYRLGYPDEGFIPSSGTFQFAVDLGPGEGPRTITLIAQDGAGNEGTADVMVSRDLGGPQVSLILPENETISTASPKVSVQLDETGACRLEYTSAQGSSILDTLLSEASAAYRYGIDAISSPLKSNQWTALRAACQDSLAQTGSLDFNLMPDMMPPVITSVEISSGMQLASSAGFAEYNVFSTKLIITAATDEPAKCKYGTSQASSALFHDYRQGYVMEHTSSEIALEDKKAHTYYVYCEDQVGMASQYRLVLHVDSEYPITIYDVLPSQYVRENNPAVSCKTFRRTKCTASLKETESSWSVPKEMTIGIMASKYNYTIQGKDISSQLNSMISDKSYTLKLQCTDPEGKLVPGTKEFSFVFDNKVTVLTATTLATETVNSVITITGNTESCSTVTVTVNGVAQDDVLVPGAGCEGQTGTVPVGTTTGTSTTTMTIPGTTITVTGTSTITNPGTGIITVTTTGTGTNVPLGTTTGTGTVTVKTPNGSVAITGTMTITNDGSGTVTITTTGTQVTVPVGTTTGTSTSVITTPAGTITITGTSTITNPGTGIITVTTTGTGTNVPLGTTTGTGTVTVNTPNGPVTITGTMTITNDGSGTVTITTTGTQVTIPVGTTTGTSIASMTTPASTITITGTSTITNAGTGTVTITTTGTGTNVPLGTTTGTATVTINTPNGPVTITGTTTITNDGSGTVTLTTTGPAPSVTAAATSAGVGSYSIPAVLTPGVNTIVIESTDLAGNTLEKTLTVTYNPPGPYVLSINPLSSSVLNSLDIIRVYLGDKSLGLVGLDLASSKIELYDSSGSQVSGTLRAVEGNVLEFIPSGALPDDDYIIRVTVYDNLGNVAQGSAWFTINSKVPKITLTSPAQFTTPIYTVKEMTYIGNSDAAPADLMSLELYANGMLKKDLCSGACVGITYKAFEYPDTLMIEGNNIYRILARNNIIEQSASLGGIIILDTTGPNTPTIIVENAR